MEKLFAVDSTIYPSWQAGGCWFTPQSTSRTETINLWLVVEPSLLA
jgi:hypothetical protein